MSNFTKVHLTDPRSGRSFEAIWVDVADNGVARLSNEPVEFPSLHKGDVVTITKDRHGRAIVYAESRYSEGVPT